MKLTYTEYKNPITEIQEDKRNDIWTFGLDNQLPKLIHDLITQSPTASTASRLAAKAILGGGTGQEVQLNKERSIDDVLSIAADQMVDMGNIYFRLGFNGELKVNSIKVIPQGKIRKGKSDDLGFSGFYHFDNKEFNGKKGEAVKIHAYNSSKEAIEKQIESVGGIQKWNGQILHVKLDHGNHYALPMCYPVLQDMLTEANSALFRANNTQKGFLNNNLLILPQLSNDEANEKFIGQFKKLEGAQGSGHNLLFQSDAGVEDIAKQFLLAPLNSQPNDKLFEYSDRKAESNIAKAFRIPQILINPQESGLFGSSGELLKAAKQFLFESYTEERSLLISKLNMVLKNWHEPLEPIKIINPYVNNS
ncbi:hypothetical protein [Allomuricauda sp. M10]|uniref:hypothetical protein n=1 Tax=Allomuricauda sp. M10 TaxID=2683292 RepID=UPI001D17E44C|nr:hypothetical protein [Muricauda sp. M10]